MSLKYSWILALLGAAAAQSVDGSKYNNPTAGPPASFFTAATTIPVAALQTAAAKASIAAGNVATYPVYNDHSTPTSTIHKDWVNFSEGAAFVFVADMDVDCDGLDYTCKGNGDGQQQTDWGALSAYEVPWIVIPEHFQEAFPSLLPGNNLAAVICDGKMFYGIYADSNGDSPEVIGEASWLMARTCFPSENLNGGIGHTGVDVTYIVFTGAKAVLPSSALNNNYITNFSTLREMGDSFVSALAKSLGLLSSGGSTTLTTTTKVATTTTTTSVTPTTTATCSWIGHCEGSSCSTDNDCADSLVCNSGICGPVCSWVDHCAGASCVTDNDCSDNLVCDDGKCASS